MYIEMSFTTIWECEILRNLLFSEEEIETLSFLDDDSKCWHEVIDKLDFLYEDINDMKKDLNTLSYPNLLEKIGRDLFIDEEWKIEKAWDFLN